MTRTFVISALFAALAAGCATTQPPAEASLAESAAKGSAAKPFCVRETGSRIKPKKGECIQHGRTYSQDELEATGAFETGEALQRLDPSITVRP